MKILLADDHVLLREGLRQLLMVWRTEATVLETGDFEGARALLRQHDDLALGLIDIRMPGMNGLSGFRALKKDAPRARLVVVSALEGRDFIRQAIVDGASGYIPKTLSRKVVINALRLVLSGAVFLPTAVLESEGEDTQTGRDRPLPDEVGGDVRLTPRQSEVLSLLSRGCSNKEIARLLSLSEGTVKLHVAALLKSLSVRNRTEAVIRAAKLGLHSPMSDRPNTG